MVTQTTIFVCPAGFAPPTPIKPHPNARQNANRIRLYAPPHPFVSAYDRRSQQNPDPTLAACHTAEPLVMPFTAGPIPAYLILVTR